MQDFIQQVDSEDIELSELAEFPDFEPSFSGNAYLRTLYLAEQGTILSKEGKRFIITYKGKIIKEILAIKVDLILIFGSIHITTATLKFCLQENIPIVFLSNTGKYYGSLESINKTSVTTHKRQFECASDPSLTLKIARSLIKTKIHNQKVVLQRYAKRRPEITLSSEIEHLDRMANRAVIAENINILQGIEGTASQDYFAAIRKLIPDELGFRKRTKQPPRDPVNSMLSLGYTLLFYNIYAFITTHGLHPYVGFLHSIREGHPSLVSDFMEELRAPIIDSLVLNIVVRKILKPKDFIIKGEKDLKGCFLTNEARKIFIRAFENKMNATITNPSNGLKTTYRKLIDYKVAMFKQFINGKIDQYKPFIIR